MKNHFAVVGFVLFFGFGFAAIADQQGPIIAVFDIQDKGSGIDEQTKDNLVDLLSARLAKAGYRVIPRDQVRKRLFEAKKETFKECYDQSCQIELGRELAAQKTLAIKILKIGATCQITAELYDLRQSATDLATTAEAKCEDEQSLLQAFNSVAEDLNRPLLGSQRKLEDGLAEMERLAKSDDGSKTERATRSWTVAEGISKDSMIANEGKVKAVRKYLDDFKEVVPEASKVAKALLMGIDLATLVVMSSPPGAKVFLNGEQAGIAPYTRELKAGEYKVSGKMDGHGDFEEKLQLQPGEKRELSMILKKIKSSTLVVKTDPPGAWVSIDGKPAGTTPVVKELKSGEHLVEARLDGFLPARQSVSIAVGQQDEVIFTLNRPAVAQLTTLGHVAFWSGLGLAAFGGWSISKFSDVNDAYEAGQDTKSNANLWNGLMVGSLSVSATFLATGVILWVLAPSEAERIQDWIERSPATATIGRTQDGTGLTLGLQGRW